MTRAAHALEIACDSRKQGKNSFRMTHEYLKLRTGLSIRDGIALKFGSISHTRLPGVLTQLSENLGCKLMTAFSIELP